MADSQEFYRITGIAPADWTWAWNEWHGREEDAPLPDFDGLRPQALDVIRRCMNNGYRTRHNEPAAWRGCPYWNVKLHMPPNREAFLRAWSESVSPEDSADLPLMPTKERAYELVSRFDSDEPKLHEAVWGLAVNDMRDFGDVYSCTSNARAAAWGFDPSETWCPEFSFGGNSGGYLILTEFNGKKLPSAEDHGLLALVEYLIEDLQGETVGRGEELLHLGALLEDLDESTTEANLAQNLGYAMGFAAAVNLNWRHYAQDVLGEQAYVQALTA